MDYLTNTLGVKLEYSDWEASKTVPFFISDCYTFKIVTIEGVKALFMYVKNEIDSIPSLKKHIVFISKDINIPLVLVLNHCSRRQREVLIRERLAFIVENKQIYLPFLAIVLQEKFSNTHRKVTKLTPSAQVVLFSYLYSKQKNLSMKELSKKLPYSAMSISRAIKQLADLSLISTYKIDQNKMITSKQNGKAIYKAAQKYLISPISTVHYIKKDTLTADYLVSGYSALSKLSNLNPPKVSCYAINKSNHINLMDVLSDETSEVKIETWVYKPKLLSTSECVDVLSLHQALKRDPDERVQIEVENMIHKFWEEIEW